MVYIDKIKNSRYNMATIIYRRRCGRINLNMATVMFTFAYSLNFIPAKNNENSSRKTITFYNGYVLLITTVEDFLVNCKSLTLTFIIAEEADDLEQQCEDAVFQICCTRERYSVRCANQLEKYLDLKTKINVNFH